MGASNDLPARDRDRVCPLCLNVCQQPVTLKCKHHFCTGCIQELWSGSPTAPYYCPECKDEYRTLPFWCETQRRTERPAFTSVRRDESNARPSTIDCTDDDDDDDVIIVNPVGSRTSGKRASSSFSSLSSRLLGKRAASSPAPEEPLDRKRPGGSSQGRPGDLERPPTSLSPNPYRPREKERPARDGGRPEREGERPSATERKTPEGQLPVSSSQARLSNLERPTTSSSPNPYVAARERERPEARHGGRPEREGERPVSAQSAGGDLSSSDPAAKRVTPAKLDTPAAPGGQPTPTDPNNASASAAEEPGKPTEPSRESLSAKEEETPPTPAGSPTLSRTRADLHVPGESPRVEEEPPVEQAGTPAGSPGAAVVPPALPCHYCPGPGQLPAVKTCLVCGASMCSDHLRPHLENPVFQSHTLVPPVEDISPWRCQEHQEMNRIYCQECAVCVCTVCTVIGSHRNHTCVSVREAERELRGNLKEDLNKLQQTEQGLVDRVAELTEKKKVFQVVLGEARAGVQQQYGAMRAALEEEERQALLCVSQEEGRAVGVVEAQLGELQNSLTSIQRGLHTLEALADSRGAARVQEQAFIMEYNKLTKSERSSVKDREDPEEVDGARLASLKEWTEQRVDSVVVSLPNRNPYRLLYGVYLSLDPDTAHLKLLLSEDNRKVAYSEVHQAYSEYRARFTSFPQVLACCALEGGHWYWEVDVSVDEGRWKVGVCEGRIGRKGQKDTCRIGFNPYSWCLVSEKGKVEALHDKVATPVNADELLTRVGVFLDFEEGSLSFYRVAQGGALTLLHRFKQEFTEPLYPALAVSKTQLTVVDLFQTATASE